MEKIDFVITWVDGNDTKWKNDRDKYAKMEINNNTELFKTWINNESRYRDWDTLKYWFRGVEKFAPWVNKIYFITYGHLPKWLNTKNEKLIIVNHEDFIPKEYLPTFNSNAIELNMHRIKNLSNNFVYFNDDVFLLKNVKPTDFFKNNHPCEMAALDAVELEHDKTHAEINNIKIINKYFNKKEVFKKNWTKWFKLRYGRHLIQTILLMPWQKFKGIDETHIDHPYKKEYFDKIWKLEKDICDKTSKNKFRNDNDINHWLVRDYQIVSGDFYPRGKSFGKRFIKKIDDDITNTIVRQKCKCVCINDVDCSYEEFLEQKKKLHKAFEKILPEKSNFER